MIKQRECDAKRYRIRPSKLFATFVGALGAVAAHVEALVKRGTRQIIVS